MGGGHKATAEINYKTSDEHTVNVISADTKNLSPDIKSALGMIAPPKHLTPKARKILGAPSKDPSGGFPLQLTPITDSVAYLPIPAIPFHDSDANPGSLKRIFNNEIASQRGSGKFSKKRSSPLTNQKNPTIAG